MMDGKIFVVMGVNGNMNKQNKCMSHGGGKNEKR